MSRDSTDTRQGWAVFALIIIMIGLPVITAGGSFDVTPAMQDILDKQKLRVAAWATNPIVVKSVAEQNAKGPIAGMDNSKWKTIPYSDPIVLGFQTNAAAVVLKRNVEDSNGLVGEVFLSAARGEKVAFAEKTSNYIHAGTPKFDVPFNTGKTWQGTPEFDESSQVYSVQVSAPVVAAGKRIGVLVVGLKLSRLGKLHD